MYTGLLHNHIHTLTQSNRKSDILDSVYFDMYQTFKYSSYGIRQIPIPVFCLHPWIIWWRVEQAGMQRLQMPFRAHSSRTNSIKAVIVRYQFHHCIAVYTINNSENKIREISYENFTNSQNVFVRFKWTYSATLKFHKSVLAIDLKLIWRTGHVYLLIFL